MPLKINKTNKYFRGKPPVLSVILRREVGGLMFDVGNLKIQIIIEHNINPIDASTDIVILSDKDIEIPRAFLIGIIDLAKYKLMQNEE